MQRRQSIQLQSDRQIAYASGSTVKTGIGGALADKEIARLTGFLAIFVKDAACKRS
jgi:hypothetical protein